MYIMLMTATCSNDIKKKLIILRLTSRLFVVGASDVLVINSDQCWPNHLHHNINDLLRGW